MGSYRSIERRPIRVKCQCGATEKELQGQDVAPAGQVGRPEQWALRPQRIDINHEAILHVAFQHPLVGLVNLINID